MAEIGTAVGAFHVKWAVGNMMPGAPLLHVDAVVVTPSHSISGVARITQAVSPPLDIDFHISGSYMDVTDRATTHFVLAATQPSHLLGAPYLMLCMVLNSDWKTGMASYSYVCGSQHGHQDNVPARIEAALSAGA